jgi:hypothetical protein
MQPEQSTSAAAADPHATSIEQRTTEQIRTAVLASEQRITEQFLAASAALLAQLQQPTATPASTDQQQSIPADATLPPECGKGAPELGPVSHLLTCLTQSCRRQAQGRSIRPPNPFGQTDRPSTATAQEMMVWPAAPIPAPRHLPSCDIACVEAGGSGSASARAAKS